MIHPSAIVQRLTLALGLILAAHPASAQLVISQIYGGGGNSGATYRNDFVEIFNRGALPIDLSGYSIQYASAAGTSWQVTSLTPVTLGSGQYYLVQQAAGTGGTTDLPAPDATGTTAVSATAGKIALVSGTTALSGACPAINVVDMVGFGSTASCFEGAFAPAPSNTLAILRAAAGCTDAANNATDFATGAPAPRNTSSPANSCTGGTAGPTASGSASLNPVTAGNATFLTATNTPGTDPVSLTFIDTCNLTPIGGGSAVLLPVSYLVPTNTPPATYPLACTVTDDQSRSGSFVLSLTVQAPPPTFRRIYEITGPGTASPLAGTTAQTRGVVTAVRGTTGATKGFYLESLPADRDSDPNTSEGLLVFVGNAALPTCAAAGNYVQIDGTVQDFVSATSPVGSTPLTELSGVVNCQVLDTNQLPSLPAAITIDNTVVTAGGSGTQARKFLGMRVTLTDAGVVGPATGNVNETSATSTVGNNFFVTASGVSRPFHNTPGIQETRRPADAAASVPTWNGNPETFRIDTTGLVGGAAYEVATGSTVSFIAGIMDFSTSASQFQIYTNAAGIGTITPAAPTLAATPIPAPFPTDLLLVDANLERFYNTVSNGGDVVLTSEAYQGRLNKLSLAIRNVMRMPDIIAVQEVEGPPSTASNPAFTVLTDIVNKLNSDAASSGQGSPNYDFCGGTTNDVGLIAAAAIYRRDRVTSLECSQYGVPTVYSTPGGGTSPLNDRPPVVFRASVKPVGSDSGLEVRLVVNHLRSLNGIDEPGVANGDRVRTKRNEQAKYLANLVSGHLGSEQSVNWSLTDYLLVAGDMNAFDGSDGYSDSVNCIAGSPAPAAQIYSTAAQLAVSTPCAPVAGLNLINLTTEDPGQRYSYSFSGVAQRIDHVLINDKLSPRMRQFVYTRNNADFPEGPTYRNDFNRPERYSDHDAPAVYIWLPMEVTSRTSLNVHVPANQGKGRNHITPISVTNTGSTRLKGPLYVFFTDLPEGVTLPDLPKDGGIPFATIELPKAGLPPGKTSGIVVVRFDNERRARLTFNTRHYDFSW